MNDSGGHIVMNLMTGAKMTKPRVWELPITETVIQAVESLAKSQGYKTLKLTGKNKTRLLPSDWDKDKEYIFDDSYDSDDDDDDDDEDDIGNCLLYTSPSPRDKRQSRMPSSA